MVTCSELAYLAINPKIQVIAPWRIQGFYNQFQGRNELLGYAAATGIPVTSTKAKPYSMDDNIAHCSYEAGALEDPSIPPPDDMWTRTIDPRAAPDEPVDIAILFEQGLPVMSVIRSIRIALSSSSRSMRLVKRPVSGGSISSRCVISNSYFGACRICRATWAPLGIPSGGESDTTLRTADLSFKNRFIGLKSRGCYDSPAMTILRLAHMDAESLVMDGKVRSLRDRFATHHWSELLYTGFYFSPEREFVENSLIFSQRRVVCSHGLNSCQRRRLQSCPLLQS
jgi:argininosuccinate synthase